MSSLGYPKLSYLKLNVSRARAFSGSEPKAPASRVGLESREIARVIQNINISMNKTKTIS